MSGFVLDPGSTGEQNQKSSAFMRFKLYWEDEHN